MLAMALGGLLRLASALERADLIVERHGPLRLTRHSWRGDTELSWPRQAFEGLRFSESTSAAGASPSSSTRPDGGTETVKVFDSLSRMSLDSERRDVERLDAAFRAALGEPPDRAA